MRCLLLHARIRGHANHPTVSRGVSGALMGFDLNWLEIWGFVTGAVCVGLQVKQNIWNWPIGITNNVLYIIVFWRSGLYADCGLQVVYIIISIYGFWSWRRGSEQHSELKISRVTPTHAAWVASA